MVADEGMDPTQCGRRGWLRSGNPPGDLSKALRCGARTRVALACRAPAMANGRCRMHGGASTGPRTAAGLARCRRSRLQHGAYSAETLGLRREVREMMLMAKATIERC